MGRGTLISLIFHSTHKRIQIGFQGNDPATDFRGMGLQGLDDLVYYASTHPESAQQTFLSSRHPVSWYPFAIVGINISQFAVQTLRTRQLQYYLFKYGCDKKIFSEFYCMSNDTPTTLHCMFINM